MKKSVEKKIVVIFLSAAGFEPTDPQNYDSVVRGAYAIAATISCDNFVLVTWVFIVNVILW